MLWKPCEIWTLTHIGEPTEPVTTATYDDYAAKNISKTVDCVPAWLSTYERLFQAYGLDYSQYHVQSHHRGAVLQKLATCVFDFDRIWLKADWTQHCRRYWERHTVKFDRILAPRLKDNVFNPQSWVDIR